MTQAQRFSPDRNFFIGLLLVVPAVLFWIAAILDLGFGSSAFFEKVFIPMDNVSDIFPISRMLVLPFIAFLLNVFSIVHIDGRKEEGEIKGNFTFKLKLMNILLVVFTIISLLAVLGYLFVENYNHP